MRLMVLETFRKLWSYAVTVGYSEMKRVFLEYRSFRLHLFGSFRNILSG